MNVISAKEITAVSVTTDENEQRHYRRHSPDSWECLMGESWETVFYTEEIEKAYQDFIKNNYK